MVYFYYLVNDRRRAIEFLGKPYHYEIRKIFRPIPLATEVEMADIISCMHDSSNLDRVLDGERADTLTALGIYIF